MGGDWTVDLAILVQDWIDVDVVLGVLCASEGDKLLWSFFVSLFAELSGRECGDGPRSLIDKGAEQLLISQL